MDSAEIDKDARRLRAIGTLLIGFGYTFFAFAVIWLLVVASKDRDPGTEATWDARDGVLLVISLVGSFVAPLVLLGIGYLCRFTGRKHLLRASIPGRELSGTT